MQHLLVGPALKLRAPQDDPAWSVGETWVEMIRTGTFYAPVCWGEMLRTVDVTREMLAGMKAVHDSVVVPQGWYDVGPPVDINHARAYGYVESDVTARRAAIKALELRDNDEGGQSLWGLWVWTERGQREVLSGDFTCVSVEISSPEIARNRKTAEPLDGWLLEGATLCNDPFIIGMEPVEAPALAALADDDPRASDPYFRAALFAAGTNTIPNNAIDTERRVVVLSARAPQPEPVSMSRHLMLFAALAIPHDATDEEALAEVQRLRGAAAERDELSTKLEGKTAELEVLTTKHADLLSQFSSLAEERRQALSVRFLSEGRCTPAQANDRTDDDGNVVLSPLSKVLAAGGKTWDEQVAHAEECFEAGRVVEAGQPDPNPTPGAEVNGDQVVAEAIRNKARELATAAGRTSLTTADLGRARTEILRNPQYAAAASR